MKNLLILVLLLGLAVSCATVDSETSPYLDLASLTFYVENVRGNVQIKENKNAHWRPMQKGETFNGYAFIRSSVNSCASFECDDTQRKTKCLFCDLVDSIPINSIYNHLLSPSGLIAYNKAYWGDFKKINPSAPVLINRDTLLRLGVDKNMTLLAEASSEINPRNADILEGLSGGATGGSGAAPAGC